MARKFPNTSSWNMRRTDACYKINITTANQLATQESRRRYYWPICSRTFCSNFSVFSQYALCIEIKIQRIRVFILGSNAEVVFLYIFGMFCSRGCSFKIWYRGKFILTYQGIMGFPACTNFKLHTSFIRMIKYIWLVSNVEGPVFYKLDMFVQVDIPLKFCIAVRLFWHTRT